jgi:hypothetical protein
VSYVRFVGVSGGRFIGIHDKHVNADEDKCLDGTNSIFCFPVDASKTTNLPSAVVMAKSVPVGE